MATHVGREGRVKIGANTIAEVVSFEYEETAELHEDTALSDAWRTRKVGHKDISGTVECMFDETDTNGQEAMSVGAAVTLDLLPEGDTTGDVRKQIAALIERVGVTIPEGGGIVRRSFGWVGNEAAGPTNDTVP